MERATLSSARRRAAPRGPSLPSDPSRPCKSRRSMGLGSLGNERALSLSLCGAGVVSRLLRTLRLPTNSCKYQQSQPDSGPAAPSPVAPNAPLFQRARRGHGTFYNPEWHGKSNLMSDGGSGNGFKGSSNPSSLNTIVVGRRGVEHKALSPWEE